MQNMQLHNALTRTFVQNLDRFGAPRGIKRAKICRRAELDPSTMWRATQKGRLRTNNAADYTETLLGMATLKTPEPDLATPAVHELVRGLCLWVAGKTNLPHDPERAAAQLTVLAGQDAYQRLFGGVGHAFLELINLKASGATLEDRQRVTLAALCLDMLEQSAVIT